MRSELRFSQISPPRQALLRLCQMVDHGSIDAMRVRNCEPDFEPPPVVVRDLKLTEDEPPRSELALDDYVLSCEVNRLLRLLDEVRDGSIPHIEVRKGLPRRVLLPLAFSTLAAANERPK